jgi:hypothetical protein
MCGSKSEPLFVTPHWLFTRQHLAKGMVMGQDILKERGRNIRKEREKMKVKRMYLI